MPMGTKGPLHAPEVKSVRDRVRQWQAQGGGVVDGEVPRDPNTDVPIDLSMRSTNKEVQDASDNGKASKIRDTGLCPAKRVVSDSHWRKSKHIDRAATSLGSTRVKTSKIGSPSNSRMKNGLDGGGQDSKDQARAGVTVDRTPLMRRDDPHALRSTTQPQKRNHSNRSSSKTHSIEPEHDLDFLRMNHKSSAQQEDSPLRVRSTSRVLETVYSVSAMGMGVDDCHTYGVENHGTAQENRSEIRSRQRSYKGRMLSQVLGDTRKALARCTSESAPSPDVPSIEHWLNSTSDSFVTTEESSSTVHNIPSHPLSDKHEAVTPVQTRASKNSLPESLESRDGLLLNTKEGTRRVLTKSKRRRRILSSAIYQDNPFPAGFDADNSLRHAAQGSEKASKLIDLVQNNPQDSGSSSSIDKVHERSTSPTRNHRTSSFHRKSPELNVACSTVPTEDTLTDHNTIAQNTSPVPPGLAFKRPFPSTGGHQLSTIASAETLNDTTYHIVQSSIGHKVEDTMDPTRSIAEDVVNGQLGQHESSFRLDKYGHITKHADLMSVLSYPVGDTTNRSAHGIRKSQGHVRTSSIKDLMRELATEEAKYFQELQTLVDGVIPVLLSCVLSRADSTVAAGLFQHAPSASADPHFTKPIVDMGIALERLKTLHKRLPKEDFAAFLTWAHGAQKVYSEYLKAWRLGFQDVVVNLAPGSHTARAISAEPRVNHLVSEGLPRNEDGDIINGEGRRVDVAFLLKRPLVRLKYLAKTLKGIDALEPSAEASMLSAQYRSLVDNARQRSYEERAKLEDEAAANIDATRCRDPRTLAPVIGVAIDRSRRVRARDHFNLSLYHSSGQRIDCRVELLLRDDANTRNRGGDLLICEIDTTERWLLFPPISYHSLSARDGDIRGEIITMVRGTIADGTQWQELLSLVSEDDTAGAEWIQMLGLAPVPPRIIRSQSFVSKHPKTRDGFVMDTSITSDNDISSGKTRTLTPMAVEVPIGERYTVPPEMYNDPVVTPQENFPRRSPRAAPEVQEHVECEDTRSTNDIQSHASTPYGRHVHEFSSFTDQTRPDAAASHSNPFPRTFKEALGLSGSSNLMGLHRSKANRTPRYSVQSLQPRLSPHGKKPVRSPRGFSVIHDRKASLSSLNIPNKQIKSSVNAPNISEARQMAVMEHQHSTSLPSSRILSGNVGSVEATVVHDQLDTFEENSAEPRYRSSEYEDGPECGPAKDRTWSAPASGKLDFANRQFARESVRERRSSSPLKHQYEPSSASKTSSNSELSTISQSVATSVSDSSDDQGLEDENEPTQLVPPVGFKNIFGSIRQSPIAAASLEPSDSASMAPYQKEPAERAKACKTIASIFSWSEEGFWQSLHPDECSVVVTPGLIEAFEMSAAHSCAEKPSLDATATAITTVRSFVPSSSATSDGGVSQGESPLVALELTPLVPLRRGTAIDISIRSPPIPSSRIRSGNNVMFRSRNPEECEALYALINHSRIHNPTFVALQNARTPYNGLSALSGTASRREHDLGARFSWFGGWGRSSSYRAGRGRARSLGPSDTSVGSLSSAFSALKRFSARNGDGAFNIAKSTIGSRTVSQENSVYASSDRSSGSGTNTPNVPDVIGSARKDDQIGLTNTVIRLYIRETASKWRDLGAARLTIMKAQSDLVYPETRLVNGESSTGYPTYSKRIVVHGKTKGEVLLDAQLGESCFERVARTGIALSVWEDVIGPNGELGVANAIGGVAGGKAKIYMIQMKSEAETAFTFSLVGKSRY